MMKPQVSGLGFVYCLAPIRGLRALLTCTAWSRRGWRLVIHAVCRLDEVRARGRADRRTAYCPRAVAVGGGRAVPAGGREHSHRSRSAGQHPVGTTLAQGLVAGRAKSPGLGMAPAAWRCGCLPTAALCTPTSTRSRAPGPSCDASRHDDITSTTGGPGSAWLSRCQSPWMRSPFIRPGSASPPRTVRQPRSMSRRRRRAAPWHEAAALVSASKIMAPTSCVRFRGASHDHSPKPLSGPCAG